MWMILFCLNTLLFANQPSLEILDMTYEDVSHGPSCLLLKHREMEREKMIRELIEIKGQHFPNALKKFLLLNLLTTNKDFFDWDTLTHETVQVHITARIPEDLQKEIKESGFANVFLSLDGVGIAWMGYVSSFPDTFSISVTESNILNLSYTIYRSHFCSPHIAKDIVIRYKTSDISEIFLEHTDLRTNVARDK